MFFKKIELNGFKSFADKTTFRFEQGITAIVGPNGCGKSNVADAIRWVLGEQGARDLRVHRLEDLIFNGSISRKPEGYAQVSITIENPEYEKQIPLTAEPQPGNGNGDPELLEEHSFDWKKFSEITVSRRYYRSAESEYLINKEPVRLKDITNLFLDTGLGGNAYSVIERDKIDLILNGKPEDRRFLFEEAAGVMKYRVRKIEAMRKLEETQANILRISDIISEVKRSINAIRRQVSRAERYKKHIGELKDLEMKLNLNNLCKIREEWEAIKDELEKARSEDEKFKKSLSSIEDKIEELRIELADKEEKLRQQRDRHYEIISSRERAASQISLIEERKKNSGQREDEIKKEITRLDERLSSLENAISRIENEMNEINLKIEQNKNALSQKEKELKNLEFEIEEKQKLEKDYLCLCCTACNWRIERDKNGCFLAGKRFKEIEASISMPADELTKPVLTIQKEIGQLENNREKFRKEMEGMRMAIVSLEGRFEAKQEFIANNRIEREETASRKENLLKEIEELPVRLKEMENEISNFKKEFETLSLELEKDKESIIKYEEEYKKVRSLLIEEESKLREIRDGRADEEAKLRELEIKEIEFKLQSENILQKLHQEYNFEVSPDFSNVTPLLENFNPEETQNQIRILREKIERIGQVNLVAGEEYQRLKERYLFLKNQMDDLIKSEENLKKLIEEVEKICKEKFTNTFDKVKENFESIYKQLFEGGEACLSLSSPDNPLETGIEITAQPPGKKLQSIFLLSTGEQTLTAISLLFALFLVKPGPFCLLDEIDAPLDDVNILRFTKLLKEFSRISQFIVITHNKRTMEMADILYGITMEEDGVSKLVSVKMEEPKVGSLEEPVPA